MSDAPLTVDILMASVMNTHRFEDIRYESRAAARSFPISRRMNYGAYSAGPSPMHSHVHEAYAEIVGLRQDTCTAAPQPVFMLTAMLATTFISMDRRHDHFVLSSAEWGSTGDPWK